MYALTCAHLTLPFDTIIRVTNLDNDREVTVRVNDRGPYVGGRIIDLSKGAAEDLGMLEAGTANVLLKVIN
jgi:rare lipoprotein A